MGTNDYIYVCLFLVQLICTTRYCSASCAFGPQIFKDSQDSLYEITDASGDNCVFINGETYDILPCANNPFSHFYFVDGKLLNRNDCRCMNFEDTINSQQLAFLRRKECGAFVKATDQFYSQRNRQILPSNSAVRLINNGGQLSGTLENPGESFFLRCINPNAAPCRTTCCRDDDLNFPSDSIGSGRTLHTLQSNEGCAKAVGPPPEFTNVLNCVRSSPAQHWYFGLTTNPAPNNVIQSEVTGLCISADSRPSGGNEVFFVSMRPCVTDLTDQAQLFFFDSTINQLRMTHSNNCLYNHEGRLAVADCVQHGGVGQFNLLPFTKGIPGTQCTMDAGCISQDCSDGGGTFGTCTETPNPTPLPTPDPTSNPTTSSPTKNPTTPVPTSNPTTPVPTTNPTTASPTATSGAATDPSPSTQAADPLLDQLNLIVGLVGTAVTLLGLAAGFYGYHLRKKRDRRHAAELTAREPGNPTMSAPPKTTTGTVRLGKNGSLEGFNFFSHLYPSPSTRKPAGTTWFSATFGRAHNKSNRTSIRQDSRDSAHISEGENVNEDHGTFATP